MTAVAVHQLVPSLAPRDAIGAHAIQVQSLLRSMGLDSELFVDEVQPGTGVETSPYRQLDGRSRRGEAWLLYQCSIGSPVADFFLRRDEPKLLNYHNVTPPGLLELWDPMLGLAVANGRRQMERLSSEVDMALAVSSYSQRELGSAGYERTAVAPLLVDLDAFDHDVDHQVLDRLRREHDAGGAEWLFVGRLTPHKAQHDLVKALAVYRRLHDSKARLRLVGSGGPADYGRAVMDYAEALGIADGVELAGSVGQAALAAYYRNADVFVCLSDHEGFCVPVLEAMHHGLPVVAFDVAALPETIGRAGLLLSDKRPSEVAAAVARVVTDERLNAALVAAGRARLKEHSLSVTRQAFASAVQQALGG